MKPEENGLTEITFQQIVESLPDAVIIVNKEGKIVYTNRMAESLFGYTKHELTGQLVELLIPERYRQNHPKLRDAFFDKPYARTMGNGTEMFAERKDGAEFAVEIWLNPIVADEGDLVQATITDVTENVSHEATIKKQLTELRVAGNYLEQLAYISAHDIKSPIITLADLVNVLLGSKDLKPDDLQLVQMQKKVIAQMQKTNKGINDILKLRQGLLSRETADSGQMTLGAILGNVTDTLRAEVENTGAALEVNLNGLDGVQFPYFYLQSIFYNLLANAIKYRKPDRKPVITFEAQRIDAQTFRFIVTDNGLGFDMESNKGNLFGIFKRFHPKIEGTGLGLHIVKSIVDAYGGEIIAKSEPDKGTSFDITVKNPILVI